MEKNGEWSKDAWESAKDIIEKIKNHKFIQKVIDGSLDENIFKRYVSQDILYCDIYESNLEKLSKKIDKEEYQAIIYKNSQVKFGDLQRKQYKDLNLPSEVTKSKITEKYTSYVTDLVENHSVQEGLASMLPCYWVYYDLGIYINENKDKNENKKNKYQDWIDTYSNPEFAEDFENYKKICDYYANLDPDKKEKMTEIFVQCCQNEYDFFNEPCEFVSK